MITLNHYIEDDEDLSEGEGESENGWNAASKEMMKDMINEAVNESEKAMRVIFEDTIKREIQMLRENHENVIEKTARTAKDQVEDSAKSLENLIKDLDKRVFDNIQKNLQQQHEYEQMLMDYINQQKIKRKQDKNDIALSIAKLKSLGISCFLIYVI